jgi:predicted Zn-dependent peptidase
VDAASVAKAKEFMLKQYPTYSQTNGYRMSMLTEWLQYDEEPNRDFEAILSSITPADVTRIARTIAASDNVVDGRIVGK